MRISLARARIYDSMYAISYKCNFRLYTSLSLVLLSRRFR